MNKEKAIIQLGVTTILFFLIWFALSRIDWRALFRVEQVKDTTMEKVGDLIYDQFERREIHHEQVKQYVDSLLKQIIRANKLEDSIIKLHIIRHEQVNAFALPDGRILVFSHLIEDCKSPEELAGVLAHELAHIQQNHIAKKLAKEIGITVLTSVLANGSPELIREVLRVVSSKAYDRELEREADIIAVKYLNKAGISSAGLADFLYRLETEQDSEYKQLNTWFGTHPDGKERADYIMQQQKTYADKAIQPMDKEAFTAVQSELKALRERVGAEEQDF